MATSDFRLLKADDFGAEALTRGQQHVDRAARALESGTLAAVTESIDRLSRTLTVFRAVLQRG